MDCLSPINGRYRDQVDALKDIFSEFSFNQTRVQVEIEYLIFLSELIPKLQGLTNRTGALRDIYINFSKTDFDQIAAYEKVTRHDIKAI